MLFVVDAEARLLSPASATCLASSLRSATPAKPPPSPTSIWRAGQGRRLGGIAGENALSLSPGRGRESEKRERGRNR